MSFFFRLYIIVSPSLLPTFCRRRQNVPQWAGRSILRQKTKVDSANRVNISQIMRIFVHYGYACVREPRPKADFLDRKGRCGRVLCRWKNRRGMEEFAMTQLTDKERTAQMNDMRSFDSCSSSCLRKSSHYRSLTSFTTSIGTSTIVGRGICRGVYENVIPRELKTTVRISVSVPEFAEGSTSGRRIWSCVH